MAGTIIIANIINIGLNQYGSFQKVSNKRGFQKTAFFNRDFIKEYAWNSGFETAPT